MANLTDGLSEYTHEVVNWNDQQVITVDQLNREALGDADRQALMLEAMCMDPYAEQISSAMVLEGLKGYTGSGTTIAVDEGYIYFPPNANGDNGPARVGHLESQNITLPTDEGYYGVYAVLDQSDYTESVSCRDPSTGVVSSQTKKLYTQYSATLSYTTGTDTTAYNNTLKNRVMIIGVHIDSSGAVESSWDLRVPFLTSPAKLILEVKHEDDGNGNPKITVTSARAVYLGSLTNEFMTLDTATRTTKFSAYIAADPLGGATTQQDIQLGFAYRKAILQWHITSVLARHLSDSSELPGWWPVYDLQSPPNIGVFAQLGLNQMLVDTTTSDSSQPVDDTADSSQVWPRSYIITLEGYYRS